MVLYFCLQLHNIIQHNRLNPAVNIEHNYCLGTLVEHTEAKMYLNIYRL